MPRVLRWFTILVVLVVVISASFLLYSQLLVDYSLENLGLALEITDQNPENVSQEKNRVYQQVVYDLMIDEAAREEIDFKSLALLELASRSLNEAIEKAGYSRAKIYLNEVTKSKSRERSIFLRLSDAVYRLMRRFYQVAFSLETYLKRVWTGKKDEPVEYSSLLLLTQAQESEKKWKLNEAAELHRKYLKLYPDHTERSFVAISLANILIRQKIWPEAEKVLEDVARDFRGSKEEEIASNLLRRIKSLKNRVVQIEQLEQLLPAYEGNPLGEKMRFKLGLAYLSINSFPQAQQSFRMLENAEDDRLRQKAKFYLGWIYKLQSRYDQGAEMMLSLLDEEEIDRELRLGLNAELADIYYQQNDVESSLGHYEAISEVAREDSLTKKAAIEAWVGLSEIEQGVIYHFNVGDQVRAERFLAQAGQYIAVTPQVALIRQKLEDIPYLGLRDLAFRQLRARRVNVAMDLFRKNMILQPKDAWTHSGLASVHILLSDLRRARGLAEAGYRLQKDEYTASVLGYLKGFLEKYDESIALYQEAVGRNADYIPARYNLAWTYLHLGEYPKALDLLLGLEKTYQNIKAVMRSKVLNNLGYTLWWLGSEEEAVDRFKQAVAVTPGFIDAQKNLDQIALGQSPKAVIAPQALTAE